MRTPAWLDVALEGGVLELQRALGGYRTLRRLLQNDWRSSCCQVAGRCEAMARGEVGVDALVGRARRRMRQQADASGLVPLLNAVATEREQLERSARALFHELDGRWAPAGLATVLSELAPLIRDERPLESAWRRFQLERGVLTALIGTLAIGAPFASWWDASSAGAVPTRFVLSGLVASPVPFAGLLGWALLLAVWQARVRAWSWLGVRSQVLAAALAAVGAAVIVNGWFVGEWPTPPSEALLACGLAALCAGTALAIGGVWLRPLTQTKNGPVISHRAT